MYYFVGDHPTAGIIIGCILSFLITTTLLFVTGVYLSGRYMKRQNQLCSVVQQQPPRILVADSTSTTVVSAPPRSRQLPAVHYTPSQSGEFPPEPPPEYVPSEPPPDYTPN